MTVRAKFKVDKIECYPVRQYEKNPDGSNDGSRPFDVEMRTITMSPVCANNDPTHENSKFWNATPQGQLTLGTINPGAWKHFVVGKEYYLDFTPAA